MNSTLSLTSISSALLLLTACGGGDSSNSQGIETEVLRPIETSLITVSENNIEDISSSAIFAVFDNLALNTADGLTGVVIEQDETRVDLSDIQWALQWLNRTALSTDSVTGVVTTETDDCLISGSITTTFDVQDTFNISVNDSITIQSNNCIDGSETLNGKFTFTFTQLDNFFGFDNYSTLGIRIELENFSVTFAGETVNMIGSYTLVHEKDIFGEEQNITSSEISISSSEYQQSIKKLISNQVFTYNDNIEKHNVSNELTDELLNGSVTITTVEDFQFNGEFTTVPFSGAMKITGADNSSVLLTILNTVDVQLDSDFDGNNTIDDTRIVTWNSLN